MSSDGGAFERVLCAYFDKRIRARFVSACCARILSALAWIGPWICGASTGRGPRGPTGRGPVEAHEAGFNEPARALGAAQLVEIGGWRKCPASGD